MCVHKKFYWLMLFGFFFSSRFFTVGALTLCNYSRSSPTPRTNCRRFPFSPSFLSCSDVPKQRISYHVWKHTAKQQQQHSDGWCRGVQVRILGFVLHRRLIPTLFRSLDYRYSADSDLEFFHRFNPHSFRRADSSTWKNVAMITGKANHMVELFFS